MTERSTLECSFDETVAFFRGEPGLERLLVGLAAKYESLGCFGGTFELRQISEVEAAALQSWFRRGLFVAGDSPKIRCDAFLKAYAATRFAEHDWREVLALVIGRPLISRRQVRADLNQAQRHLLHGVKDLSSDISWQNLVVALQERRPGTRVFWNVLAEDQDYFFAKMLQLCQILTALPADEELVPVFANRLLGEPHALDSRESLARMLQAALCLRSKLASDDDVSSSPDHKLWRQYGLIRDDVLNFVSCFGLELREGQHLHYSRYACEQNALLNIPLATLDQCVEASAYGGGPVFILENSGVFSNLVKQSIGRFPGALVCFHGQLKQASWRLLELLEGKAVFYSGDLDPAGVSIADKVFSALPGAVQPWCMDEETYLNHLKQGRPGEVPEHWQQGIRCPGLQGLAKVMSECQRVIFQESLMELYLKDLLGTGTSIGSVR